MNILRKNKNIFVCLVIILSIFFTFSGSIYAQTTNNQGIFDTVFKDGIYKLSDDSMTSYLPFIRYATDTIIMDKEVSDMGILFSAKSVEVNSSTKDIQLLFATDTVRINSTMEYAIIFASGNVVVNSNIARSAIIISNGRVVISDTSEVADDLIVVCKELQVDGTVKGSVLGAVNTIIANGVIEKDLRLDVINTTISNNEVIKGNVYINTTNKEISIKDMYDNATVNIYEIEENKVASKDIINVLFASFMFAVIYIVIQKISNKKAVYNTLEKVKENMLPTVLFGIIFMITIPLVLLILIILSIVGLSKIAIPAIIAYIAFLIVISMLSTLIVGSVMFEHVKQKYIKDCNIWLELIGSFFTFSCLHILARLPYIGTYISYTLVILAIGIMICVIFKKKKVKNKEEIVKIEE